MAYKQSIYESFMVFDFIAIFFLISYPYIFAYIDWMKGKELSHFWWEIMAVFISLSKPQWTVSYRCNAMGTNV